MLGKDDKKILSRQSGSSLIETMIALLVVAFGFLGYSYMGGVSVKASHDNLLRAQANVMATDILEKMRANIVFANEDPTGYRIGENDDGNDSDCYSAPCTANEIADWDLFGWKSRIDDSLLDASGDIDYITLGDGSRKYVVTIEYAERVNFSDAPDDIQTYKVVVATVL